MSRSLLMETGTVIAIEDGTDLYLEQDTYRAEVLADSPVSYWRLGETSGTNAADEMGINAGTYNLGYTQNQTGAIQGDTDKAVLLNGTTGYINVPDHATLDLGDGPFTLEAWIKRASTGTEDAIIAKGVGAYLLWIYSNNNLRLTRQDVAHIVDSTVTITDTTTWHHVVATKTGATVKLYIDGSDVTGSVTNSTMVDTATALQIGRKADPISWFDGYLDEVAIYNTVLSASRVQAHYNAGITA